MKITRFYLTDTSKIAPAEFTDDPDQVEAVLKKHGVEYRREDSEYLPPRKVFFRIVSSLNP